MPDDEQVTQHAQVNISANRMHGSVDVGLAPLIELLWAANIRTRFSCQATSPPPADHPSGYRGAWSWINFKTSGDLQAMLELLVERSGYDSELSSRILGHEQPAWRYRLSPTKRPDLPFLTVHYMVYFPKRDINEIVQILSRHPFRDHPTDPAT